MVRTHFLKFGQTLAVELHGDATAAQGMSRRMGVGKVRHLSRDTLWVQQKVRCKELKIVKTPGKTNMADLETKYLTEKEIMRTLARMGYVWCEGRSAKSLAAAL